MADTFTSARRLIFVKFSHVYHTKHGYLTKPLGLSLSSRRGLALLQRILATLRGFCSKACLHGWMKI
jgi:hypothetical protein